MLKNSIIGFKLDENTTIIDTKDDKKGFNVITCDPSESIKVKLGVDGQIYVETGHHTLG